MGKNIRGDTFFNYAFLRPAGRLSVSYNGNLRLDQLLTAHPHTAKLGTFILHTLIIDTTFTTKNLPKTHVYIYIPVHWQWLLASMGLAH